MPNFALFVFVFCLPIWTWSESRSVSNSTNANDALHTALTKPVVVHASPLQSFANQGGIWNYTKVQTRPATPSLEQDLNSTQGISSRSQGSPGISIRGSGQSNRVLSMVDGVTLFSATGIGSQSLLMPIENVEQLQVYKTPASTFYGASAMGGVLNFQTEELKRARARVQLGSYDGTALDQRSVYVGTPLWQSPTNRLQATAFFAGDSGNFRFATPEAATFQNRKNNGQHLLRSQIKGRQKVADFEIEENLIFSESQKRSAGSLYYPGVTTTQTSAQLVALGIQTRKAPYGEMGFRSSGLFEYLKSLESENSTTAQSLQQTLRYELKEVETSPEFTVNYRSDTLRAGYLDGQHMREDQPELGVRLLFPGGEDYPHWTVQTGARYLTQFGKFVKAFGMFYEHEANRIWGNYSEGFRAPTLADRFTQTSFFTGNPLLKPELSRGIEVGWRHRLMGPTLFDQQGLFLTVSAFRTNYEELIEYQFQGFQQTPVNRGEALVEGAESEIGYQGGVWRASFGSEFTESSERLAGRELRLTPRQKHIARAAYQWGPMETELRYTYSSKYLDSRLQPLARSGEMAELGPWRTVDLSVQTVGFAHFVVQGGVLNILNEQRQYTFGYPEPGRVFYISYQRDF